MERVDGKVGICLQHWKSKIAPRHLFLLDAGQHTATIGELCLRSSVGMMFSYEKFVRKRTIRA